MFGSCPLSPLLLLETTTFFAEWKLLCFRAKFSFTMPTFCLWLKFFESFPTWVLWWPIQAVRWFLLEAPLHFSLCWFFTLISSQTTASSCPGFLSSPGSHSPHCRVLCWSPGRTHFLIAHSSICSGSAVFQFWVSISSITQKYRSST